MVRHSLAAMHKRLLIAFASLAFPLALATGCQATGPVSGPSASGPNLGYQAKEEQVVDFAARIPAIATSVEVPSLRLERISAGVPWPRGLAWVDDELVVLARGRHRRAGGVDHSIEDHTGSLFRVDPDIYEAVIPGQLASVEVAGNASILAMATDSPFYLPDRSKDPEADYLMDRPYCTLIWDEASRNFFLCGYSGVDLPGQRFRKNATDSIHRFDRRTDNWYPVEMHDAAVVPVDELGYTVSNRHYPHHDVAVNAAPHGWLNGPDGGCVAGDYLYCVSKDNHLVVQYDLAEIRENPEAGFPESRPVLGSTVMVSHPLGTEQLELLGPSAASYRDGYLYLGYRTSSVIVRFAVDGEGALVQPVVGELIAAFEPWDETRGRSANLIDMAFNGAGELFVSCSKEGRVWKVGTPDPARPFYGNDQTDRPSTAPPYVDLAEMTGKKTSCGNIIFDDEDRLYVCAGNYDTNSAKIAGVIYRVIEG